MARKKQDDDYGEEGPPSEELLRGVVTQRVGVEESEADCGARLFWQRVRSGNDKQRWYLRRKFCPNRPVPR